MDVYLLDTNVVSSLLKGNRPKLAAHAATIPVQRQIIPSIVRAELLFGWIDSPHFAPRLTDLERFLDNFPTLPFDNDAARQYGRLRSYLKQNGLMIGPNDLMIASIALSHDLVLVSHNTGEFGRVPGLRLEDWQD